MTERNGHAGAWREVSAAAHCPICDKPDWCSVSDDGGAVACRREVDHPTDQRFQFCGVKDDRSGGVYRSWRIPTVPLRNGKAFTIAATYDYRDADGALLFQVCRMDPKDFRQRKPAGNGGWTWKLGDVSRVLYRLPELLAADPRHPVFVVEGEKDADRLAGLELVATTNAGGAGKWLNAYSKSLHGRHVVILTDNDDPGHAHAERVANALHSVAASVKVIDLPGLPPKGDVSDWLDAGGTREALQSLVDESPAWTTEDRHEYQPDDRPTESNEDVADPHRLARLFIQERFDHPERIRLAYWRGEYFEWSGACWHPLGKDQLRSELTIAVKAEFDRANVAEMAAFIERGDDEKPLPKTRQVTRSLITNVLQAVESLVILHDDVEQPAWLSDDPAPFDPGNVVIVRNGIVDLDALIAGKEDHLHRPTPQLWSQTSMGTAFDLDAPPPEQWLCFLSDLWPNDAASIETLQEWFGLMLTPDTAHHKILMLIGPPRSGKGTAARVLTALLDRANVAGPTLSGLGTNFGLWPLLGKPLAIISDARLSGRTDTATVIERLLSISGEDSITIDRKNMQPITCRLPTRFMILTNELPRLGDSSGAIASRFIVLTLQQSFLGREDKALESRLVAELPAILNWAITGRQRLRERGWFVQPETGADAIADLNAMSSPVGEFIAERCAIGPMYMIPVADLYAAWKVWCETSGRQPGDVQKFGRDLRAAQPQLHRSRPRDGEDRIPTYVGIGLKF